MLPRALSEVHVHGEVAAIVVVAAVKYTFHVMCGGKGQQYVEWILGIDRSCQYILLDWVQPSSIDLIVWQNYSGRADCW